MLVGEEKFTVLIVDDERSNIAVLSNILRPAYVVLAAKDGPSAIKLAVESQPDLILMDILMPEMSGFEAITELKNCDSTRNIPVIFITGLDSRQEEAKGLALGAVDYITKPFHNMIVRLRVDTHRKIIEQMRTIERLGFIDALTGIPNRRSFDHQLSVEWERAVRLQSPLSVLMLDIDRFKNFNDRYGHAHGDVVLRTVGAIITRSLKRAADFAARWGGEEFAVLLPDADINGGLTVAEFIRKSLENAVILYTDGRETRITVSIGVHAETPTSDKKISETVVAADKALYLAKETGRNKVCRYNGS